MYLGFFKDVYFYSKAIFIELSFLNVIHERCTNINLFFPSLISLISNQIFLADAWCHELQFFSVLCSNFYKER